MLKNINIPQFLTLEFWFRNAGPASLGETGFWLIVFLLTIASGIMGLLYNRCVIHHYPPKNRILKPAAIGLIVSGGVGVIFSSFHWQGINFLGARAFLLLIFIASLVWTAVFVYLYRKKIPGQSIKYEAGLIKQKYLSK
ncbi:MAG: hypothetical protein A2Z24_00175 [Candidatus Woykebacteria bacterium RBG_16_44_10]|uniref:Uncharacterized protein n=1 Tax=Candidatus Woykebacteria bacterium RBG_16_44_10 TaxID=1802597 RepID=A0A1G1WFQ7_9BACT|nr:MAG: hypothetical protein A2Z24_00175 [Candidatus Woykebacteria bacterium RBG_16_44_10]